MVSFKRLVAPAGGYGHTAVASEGEAGNFDAGRRLSSFVFVYVDHAKNARRGGVIYAVEFFEDLFAGAAFFDVCSEQRVELVVWW